MNAPLSLCLQLLLAGGGGWGLAPPRRVHLVRRWHQTHPSRGDAERKIWWYLPHPREPVTEGLLCLLCSVSFCSFHLMYWSELFSLCIASCKSATHNVSRPVTSLLICYFLRLPIMATARIWTLGLFWCSQFAVHVGRRSSDNRS